MTVKVVRYKRRAPGAPHTRRSFPVSAHNVMWRARCLETKEVLECSDRVTLLQAICKKDTLDTWMIGPK